MRRLGLYESIKNVHVRVNVHVPKLPTNAFNLFYLFITQAHTVFSVVVSFILLYQNHACGYAVTINVESA